MTNLNRREFLTAALAAGTAATLENPAFAQRVTQNNALASLRARAFTDQYGENFNAHAVLGGKPFMMVFGFNGCQQCQEIANSLSALQEKPGLQQNVPIVVISTKPETDRHHMPEYVASYNLVGIKQLATDETGLSEERQRHQYNNGKNVPARQRKLHILCAPTVDDIKKIWSRTELNLPTFRNNHPGMLLVCDGNGAVLKKIHAVIDADDTTALNNVVKQAAQALNSRSK